MRSPPPRRAPRVAWLTILILSLGLNGALLAVLTLTQRGTAAPSPHPSKTALAPPRSERTAGADPAVQTNGTPLNWAQIASTNLADYAAKLCEVGCPEDMARVILGAEIKRAVVPQLLELERQRDGNFWPSVLQTKRKRKTPPPAFYEQAVKELRTLRQERDRQLTEFGEPNSSRSSRRDRYPDDDGNVDQRRFLSEEKQALIASQESKRDALRWTLRNETIPEPEAQQRLAALKAAQTAELQQTLTQAEFDEYRLRASGFDTVRQKLYGFVPTADEHRALVRLQEMYNNKVPKEEWSRLLGADRAAEFERAQDGEFANLYKVVDRLALPATIAVDAFELKRQAEEAAREIRSNSLLSQDEQAALLAEIQVETRQSLHEALGERAMGLYQKQGMRWLDESFRSAVASNQRE